MATIPTGRFGRYVQGLLHYSRSQLYHFWILAILLASVVLLSSDLLACLLAAESRLVGTYGYGMHASMNNDHARRRFDSARMGRTGGLDFWELASEEIIASTAVRHQASSDKEELWLETPRGTYKESGIHANIASRIHWLVSLCSCLCNSIGARVSLVCLVG